MTPQPDPHSRADLAPIDSPPAAPTPPAAEPYRYRKLAVSGVEFAALRDLIDVLLQPTGGCPWDKEQTLNSLCQLFPMEVAEVREAVQNGDRARIFEELGDCMMLLLLLLAKAQNLPVGENEQPWDAAKALELVREKIVRRHTWIFGADKAASPAEVERLWEQNKRREKPAQPPAVPADPADSANPANAQQQQSGGPA